MNITIEYQASSKSNKHYPNHTNFDYYRLTSKDGVFVAMKFNSSGDNYVGLDVDQDGIMIMSIERYKIERGERNISLDNLQKFLVDLHRKNDQ